MTPALPFHPIITNWFTGRFASATDVQIRAWPAIQSGRDLLISAPTGSGKTLAAFLSCIDRLFCQALRCDLRDETQILYVSPLKALSNDVQKNLQQPLTEIGQAALAAGLLLPDLRVVVRTGDTPMTERQQMLRRPPHILITTPESLFILLTAEKSRAMLRTVCTVIVDEIHAVAPNKRGAHLALSLERAAALAGGVVQRIGLSATQRPIGTVAEFLVGNRSASTVNGHMLCEAVGHRPSAISAVPCTIIDVGHRRDMDLAVEVPKDELGAVATNAIWSDVYDRVASLVEAHRSTLVFVNTRRLAERVSHYLQERLRHLGEDVVAAHHGSLSREIRLSAEDRLKTGAVRVVVATASLELGIDVGTVDLVCQIGSPRSIATCLQRIGRAGHWVHAIPKGRLFATTRDELIECAALIRAIRTGVLDRIEVPPAPLDVLAQQIVAAAATQSWDETELFELCRRAMPYRDLTRASFDAVVHMLAEGFVTSRGRGRAYLHHDRINHRIRGRRGARLTAITSGGAIPDTANYVVIAEPDGTVVGSVDEDFAVESLAGDIILLGNTSWRIKGVETGKMRVEDAQGAPPTIPFWRGEAPARTADLSSEVATLRDEIDQRLGATPSTAAFFTPPVQWLKQECGLDQRGAQQAVEYILAGKAVLGTVPTQQTIVAERFFDESGGMQLVIHAPFGGRVNRAWGLALRKRFCVTFDFELQAAATDEGIVLSLGEKHSFPLDTVFAFLSPGTLREVLTQAVLQAPMFMTRWRWNASRALALLRCVGGKRVPPQIQRMRAEDLLAAVFPDAIACQDNFQGERTIRQIPDHPLAQETIRDCLTEAMDVDGLIAVLERIESGAIACRAVDTPLPSVFCHEILNANPYAFLDDAPLEERRARAVDMRRTLPPELAGEMGALDQTAIDQVIDESWPVVRDAEEFHDALLSLGWVPCESMPGWDLLVPTLSAAGRLVTLWQGGTKVGWLAAECRHYGRQLFSDARIEPSSASNEDTDVVERDEVLTRVVLGWMESIGPTTAGALAARLHLATQDVYGAMLRLEAQGHVLRGRFSLHASRTTSDVVEWCHRRLLARIHRLTIGRLRKEIEPVSAAEFMRFLFQWQRAAPGARLHGEAGLLEVVKQLGGFEAAASAWESQILRVRMAKYQPEWLDRLCLSGALMWGRVTPHPRLMQELAAVPGRRVVPTRVAPVGLFAREDAPVLLASTGEALARFDLSARLSSPAQAIRRCLQDRGASFFSELLHGTRLLASEVEDGLWELVAAGLVTADGFDNLRALIDPKRRRAEASDRSRRPRHVGGRWSLLRPTAISSDPRTAAEASERVARQLLQRYGVVFRDLLARESIVSSWRDLLVCYRRLEFTGEIRGGRFVSGFTGEQFALPSALESLRAMKKRPGSAHQQEIKLSAADPLNLAGVILPGPRIAAVPSNFVVFRDGLVVRTVTGRDTHDRQESPTLEVARRDVRS
ncbi:DEAD/DEAH box helicase [Nitrospira defluvii]|uniref:ATP-dependent DNA helicase Lhr n=1 Tax=Nitrospira defluvii TaxID=330214 RepID=A0ABM8QC74_9BACT|nr:DEAD/DEAH box helicase [Nitrospira defluvii]CAE6689263.1 Putative ATP-dependent DNA helicase Lhr [Nitrospira defluvii]